MKTPSLCLQAARGRTLLGMTLAAVATTASAETGQDSGLTSLLQVGLGLAVVLALIFAAGWLVRRLGLQNRQGGRLLKVVSSLMVGQRERVVLVEIGDTWLLLGVGAGQVNTLHTMAAQHAPDASPKVDDTDPDTFANRLRQSLSPMRQPGKSAP